MCLNNLGRYVWKSLWNCTVFTCFIWCYFCRFRGTAPIHKENVFESTHTTAECYLIGLVNSQTMNWLLGLEIQQVSFKDVMEHFFNVSINGIPWLEFETVGMWFQFQFHCWHKSYRLIVPLKELIAKISVNILNVFSGASLQVFCRKNYGFCSSIFWWHRESLEVYSELSQTSKMEHFAKTVNSF